MTPPATIAIRTSPDADEDTVAAILAAIEEQEMPRAGAADPAPALSHWRRTALREAVEHWEAP